MQNCTKPSFHNNQSFLQKVSIKGNQTDENGQSLHEDVKLWMCDPVECIKDLIGNPLFKEHMDKAGSQQLIDDMWMVDWWWDKQKELPEGATIAPIILASDKTMLSQFQGDKSAWPVYLSIGNIAKEKQRQTSTHVTVLIGYLPAIKLDCFTSNACWILTILYCLSLLLEPLIAAVYPILAAYVADFSAQCLVACCKENCCPKCLVAADERLLQWGNPLNSVMQDLELTKEILERRRSGQHPVEFDEYGLHTVYKPFWANLPHTDIFMVFTPDLLHQLHKGVFKDHLVKWCLDIVGNDKINTHFKTIPDYPSHQHFKKGISNIKQWTGTEHKEMQCIFMALITFVIVAWSILDFCYYAQLHTHTSEYLDGLENAHTVFHVNKDVLKELTVRKHFNILKLHQLSHYIQSIKLFGAANGFNTELPEHLHINFAKGAYHASNKCDYKEQMEAIFWWTSYLEWVAKCAAQTEHECEYNSDSDAKNEDFDMVPVVLQDIVHVLAKTLPHPQQSVQHLEIMHGATDFLPAFKSFLQKNFPHNRIVLSYQDYFDVFQQVVIILPPDPHVQVTQVPAVAQVHVIFMLPHQFGMYSRPLAYIEWFTLFREADQTTGLHQVTHSTHCLCQNGAVIHVDEIIRPFNPTCMSMMNMYELVSEFYLNTFIDLETSCMSTMIT
ncbi:uncharacterized protein F5147DRAFT_745378 [Suillus discolor]|uniref:Uncharacterized protein n=1 Tax=Suillus discolor TaxID=1912936 RepID=A0A9P7JVB4_9AGAM|nr:uncharacterized protein F5147DRAFT_745378 [Suillus discolor]KAG2109905.1 hypothetical protein F5147DRAFT_745378 [Suillus discolor]